MQNTVPLDKLCAIAMSAGERIMAHRRKGLEVETKQDGSSVTQADREANDAIVAALTAEWPAIPVVSEEDPASFDVSAPAFWLVDPLDGTRGFIRGEDEFTVNIALVENGASVLGVIYLPATETLYYGKSGGEAWKQAAGSNPTPIQARPLPSQKRIATLSRYHASSEVKALLVRHAITESVGVSSSYKFCLIAEGAADYYPRLGRTMEWDTAAGHAIVTAAGGRMTTLDGAPFTYGKPGFENPGFEVWGKG